MTRHLHFVGVVFLLGGAAAGQTTEQLRRERDHLLARSQEQFKRGLHARALDSARGAVRLSEAVDGRNSPAMAEALEGLIRVHMDLDEYREASSLVDHLLRIRQTIDAARPWLIRDAEVHRRYVRRMLELTPEQHDLLRQAALEFDEAKQFVALRDYPRAAALTEKALAARRAVVGYADNVYLEHLTDLAYLRLLLKGQAAGRKLMVQAQRLQRELVGEMNHRHAVMVRRLSLMLGRLGELDESAKLSRYAADIFRVVAGRGSSSENHCLDYLATTREHQANRERGRHDYRRAAAYQAAAADTWRERHGPDDWRVFDARSKQREDEFYAKAPLATLRAASKAVELRDEAQKRIQQKKYREALGLMEQGLRILEAAVTARHRAGLNYLWEMSLLHARLGEIDLAGERADLCVRLTRETLGQGHPRLIQRLDSLIEWREEQIDSSRARGDLPAALRFCEKLKELTRLRYPGREWRVKTIDWRMAHLRRLGRLSPDDRRRVVEAGERMSEAHALRKKGEMKASRERLEEALAVYQRLLDETDYYHVDALHKLGGLLVTMGDLVRAEKTIRRTLALRERALTRNHSLYAFALQNLATLYAKRGNWPEALEAEKQRVAILDATLGPEHVRYAEACTDLATAYLNLDRRDQALAWLDKASGILEKAEGEDRASFAQVLNTRAALYAQRRRPEFAAELYQRAGAIWKEVNDPIQHAISLDNLGGVLTTLGSPDQAEASHREALRLFREHLGDLHPTTALGFANLAAAHSNQGAYPSAAKLQLQALTAARFNLTLASTLQPEQQQLWTFRHFRKHLEAYLTYSGRAALPADQAWEQLLAWKGFTTLRQQQNRLARLDPKLNDFVEQLRADTARLSAVAFALPTPAERDAWKRRVAELTAAREESERKLTEAIAARPEAQALQPATPQAVKRLLPASAVLLDFFVHRDNGPRLGIFVIRKGRPVARLDLGPVAAIADAVDRWRKARGGPDHGGSAAARELHKHLWQPLAKHLAGVDLVLVSHDGPVGRLPLGALPADDTGKYLIEDFAFVTVPVPQLLPSLLADLPRAGKGPPSLLLVGDIDFDADPGRPASTTPAPPPGPAMPAPDDRGPAAEKAVPSERPFHFTRLPGFRKEMAEIDRVYQAAFKRPPAAGLRGAAATVQALRTRAPGMEYVHLATHGLFAPAPLRSALAPADEVVREPLVDERFSAASKLTITHPGLLSSIALAGANHLHGMLTATELAEIDLSRARLVVLSACETGLGDTAGGEGLLGLQRALHVAGARSAVTSLWQVNDSATQTLMVEFYTNLWQRKQPPLAALRAAQRALLTGYDYDPRSGMLVRGPAGERVVPSGLGGKRLSPYYWAGFTLSGDWR